MAESVTKRLGLVHNGHWPVAGNGRLIAGYQSISDQSYRMVSLGYVSQVLATSGPHRSAACKFMVMFLQFAQRQKHCCLRWHQSLTSCRCSWGGGSQLDPSLGPRGGRGPLLLWQCECHRCYFIHLIDCDLLSAFTFSEHLLISVALCCFKYGTCWYDMAVCTGDTAHWFVVGNYSDDFKQIISRLSCSAWAGEIAFLGAW